MSLRELFKFVTDESITPDTVDAYLDKQLQIVEARTDVEATEAC